MVKKLRKKPYRKLTRKMGARFMLLLAFFAVLGLYILGRLVWTVAFKSDTYEKKVLSQQSYTNVEIPYKRGDIYDTNGTVLATSKKYYKVILEPKSIIGIQSTDDNGNPIATDNQNAVVEALVKYLGVDRDKVLKILSDNPDSYYYDSLLKNELTESEAKGLKNYLNSKEGKDLDGIYLVESYDRVYPNVRTACHLLGFLSADGNGTYGIENYYDSTLKGTNGRRYTYLNEKLEYDNSITDAVNGKSVVSTIDLNIQKISEKYLNEIQDNYGAKNISVLVMNPNNGEVLAMANSKTFDPNDPMDDSNLSNYCDVNNLDEYLEDYYNTTKLKKKLKKMTKQEKKEAAYSTIWNNYVVNSTYEPGSTFKPFNVAMALESGALDGSETFKCVGYKMFNKTKIGCSHVHGEIPLSTTIAMSCNSAMMEIAEKVGTTTFGKYQRIFGFGQKTGIDLPGEDSGLLHNPKEMKDTDLATNSFGQGFNCTMIQLGSAFCSLINGGYYYQPHVVKQILDNEGNVETNVGKTLIKKTVSEETSETLRSFMRETVTAGTARVANISEYDICGKTGTAQKLPRSSGKRLVSFIGFANQDNPDIMVYMTIDELQTGSQSNTKLAVKAVSQIIRDSLEYMNVPDNSEKATTESE